MLVKVWCLNLLIAIKTILLYFYNQMNIGLTHRKNIRVFDESVYPDTLFANSAQLNESQ